MPGPADRERDAIELLDRWPADSSGVLIGGYAVSAYGPPRYSVDLDIVLPAEESQGVERWLGAQQFALQKRWKSRGEGSGAVVSRWQRGAVTIDLLVGAIRDREAAVDVPAAWVMERPQRLRLVLLSGSTAAPVPVCRPAALWALKLQAGRPQDLSDLFMLCELPTPLGEVRALFESLWCPSLERKLGRVQLSLEDERVYRDACSRRSLGSPTSPPNRKKWQAFRSLVKSAIPSA